MTLPWARALVMTTCQLPGLHRCRAFKVSRAFLIVCSGSSENSIRKGSTPMAAEAGQKMGLCGLEGPDAVDFLAVFAVGEFEIVMELEAEKESGGHAEEAGEPEIMDGGDPAFAVLHFRDVAGDDAAGGGEIFLAEGGVFNDFGECLAEGVEKGDGLFRCHGSVVVCDFHVVGVTVFPAKGDAPLFVDADGVESFEISSEGFEVVASGMAEVLEFGGDVDGDEFDFGTGLDFTGELTGEFTFKDLGSGFV